jgi:hypothetical protein
MSENIMTAAVGVLVSFSATYASRPPICLICPVWTPVLTVPMVLLAEWARKRANAADLRGAAWLLVPRTTQQHSTKREKERMVAFKGCAKGMDRLKQIDLETQRAAGKYIDLLYSKFP